MESFFALLPTAIIAVVLAACFAGVAIFVLVFLATWIRFALEDRINENKEYRQ